MYQRTNKALVAGVLALGLAIGGCSVIYATGIGSYLVDTFVNNHVIQPARRSRLDSDADYRRSIEVQARGLLATYQRAQARLPLDQKALATWMAANPAPWGLMQQEEYANQKAQVDGDVNAATRAATDYNALVANPDNAGLLTFDPDLPPNLALPG